MANRITISAEHARLLRESNGAIFAAGHLANWEIAPLAGWLNDQPLVLIYRHMSNPLAERMIRRIRARYSLAMHPKGQRGAREVLRALKQKQSLGLLIDQRMNEGAPLNFFGQPAMTATATAELALRFRAPILLARVVRQQGAYFHFTLEKVVLPEENSPEAALALMQQLNDRLESWIRENPGQWLWIHRRWGNLLKK